MQVIYPQRTFILIFVKASLKVVKKSTWKEDFNIYSNFNFEIPKVQQAFKP